MQAAGARNTDEAKLYKQLKEFLERHAPAQSLGTPKGPMAPKGGEPSTSPEPARQSLPGGLAALLCKADSPPKIRVDNWHSGKPTADACAVDISTPAGLWPMQAPPMPSTAGLRLM